jgi:hypothetical protein
MGGRGRRLKQLLDDLKEKRENCKLKEEAQDCTVWRIPFGKDDGHVRDCRTNVQAKKYKLNRTLWRGCGR